MTSHSFGKGHIRFAVELVDNFVSGHALYVGRPDPLVVLKFLEVQRAALDFESEAFERVRACCICLFLKIRDRVDRNPDNAPCVYKASQQLVSHPASPCCLITGEHAIHRAVLEPVIKKAFEPVIARPLLAFEDGTVEEASSFPVRLRDPRLPNDLSTLDITLIVKRVEHPSSHCRRIPLIVVNCHLNCLQDAGQMDAMTFIERWTKSLELGSAGVFIGAGLSRRAGYPDWRTLLADIARELGLDIELEHDLASVAQYSLNKVTGKRTN